MPPVLVLRLLRTSLMKLVKILMFLKMSLLVGSARAEYHALPTAQEIQAKYQGAPAKSDENRLRALGTIQCVLRQAIKHEILLERVPIVRTRVFGSLLKLDQNFPIGTFVNYPSGLE